MAQKNTVEITVKATTDQAQSAFKKLNAAISTSTGGIKKSLLNYDTAARNASKGIEALTGFSLSSIAGIAGVGLAINKVKDFMVDAVGTTADYGRTIFEMSQKIGASAEETSRLVQVADDFKISVGEMEGAMRIALRNGFQPSIENLAQLADRIKGINDPTQRAAELTKIFGRNWESLLPMLLAGGDAIRDNAAAVSDSLIMTDESIAATEEYRLAVDALGDSWTGVKMIIGKQAIPALTDLLDVINELTPVMELLDNGISNDVVSLGALSYAVALAENKFNPLKTGMDDVVKAAKQMEEAHKAARQELEKVSGRTPREMQLLQQNTQGAADAFIDLESNVEATGEILAIYSKALDKTGLSQSTQNRLLLQYADSIGAVGAQTLIVNDDLALMQQAVEAGIIPIDDLGKALILAADGQMVLDDATRDGIEAQLKDAEAKGDNAQATKDLDKEIQLLIESQRAIEEATRKATDAYLDQAEQFAEIDDLEIARAALEKLQAARDAGLITDDQYKQMWKDLAIQYGITNQAALDLAGIMEKLPSVASQLRFDPGAFTSFTEALENGASAAQLWNDYGLEMTVVNGQIVGSFPTMQQAFDMSADSITGLNDAAMDTPGLMTEAGLAIDGAGVAAQNAYSKLDSTSAAIDRVRESAKNAKGPISELQRLIDKLKSKTITINVNTNYAKILSETYDKGRASGGPVMPGQSYVVGERGPELFVPSQSGMIVPNQQLPIPFEPGAKTYNDNRASSQQVTIQNSFPIQAVQNQLDMKQLARMVASEIARNPTLR